MSEYISRKTAYQFFKDQLEEEAGAYSKGRNAGLRVAMSAVMNNDAIPTADVVEVVRCKDCKYSEHWYRDKCLCRLWYGEEKPSAPIDVFDDGFCNYGERREDDV